jgi:hypothetical protein
LENFPDDPHIAEIVECFARKFRPVGEGGQDRRFAVWWEKLCHFLDERYC